MLPHAALLLLAAAAAARAVEVSGAGGGRAGHLNPPRRPPALPRGFVCPEPPLRRGGRAGGAGACGAWGAALGAPSPAAAAEQWGWGRRRCRPRRAGEDRARPPLPFPSLPFPEGFLGKLCGAALRAVPPPSLLPRPGCGQGATARGRAAQGRAAQRSAHPRRCAGGELPAGLSAARGWVWGRGWGWRARGGVAAPPGCSPRPPRGGSPCGGAGWGWGCAAARRWRRCSAAPRRRQASGGRGAPTAPGPARSPLGSPGAAPLPLLPFPSAPFPRCLRSAPRCGGQGSPPPPPSSPRRWRCWGPSLTGGCRRSSFYPKTGGWSWVLTPRQGGLLPSGGTRLCPQKAPLLPRGVTLPALGARGCEGAGASRLPAIKLAWGLSAG